MHRISRIYRIGVRRPRRYKKDDEMSKRVITTQIDGEMEFQIEFLKRHLGAKNTTQVLSEAVQHLYNSIKQQKAKRSPFELLEELNLIGCFEGEKSLSQNYKKELSKSLNSKNKVS